MKAQATLLAKKIKNARLASLDIPSDKKVIQQKKRYEYDFYIKQFLQGNKKIKNFETEMMLTTGLVDYYFGNFSLC